MTWGGALAKLGDVRLGDLPEVLLSQFGSLDVADHTALIQKAFDEAPIGSTLTFPPRVYEVSGSGSILRLSRWVNLKGNGAQIYAAAANSTTDLLRVQIDEAGAHGDIRNWFCKGFTIEFHFGIPGRHAILVNADEEEGALPMLNPQIAKCLVGTDGGTGAAIFIAGEVHSARILNCPIIKEGIEFGVFEGSRPPADAQRVEGCLIGGARTGIKLRAQYGSYSHTLQRNVIVCRDAGIDIVAASQVKIRDTQIEQKGINAHPDSALIVIGTGDFGSDGVTESVEITGCNLGGAYPSAGGDEHSQVNSNIKLVSANHCLIDNNDFSTPGTVASPSTKADVTIASGCSYNKIGLNNRARGAGRGPFPPTNLILFDFGTGTFGAWKFLALPLFDLSNGWASSAASYRKGSDGIVAIAGQLTSGTTTGGTLMFTLPVGARPIEAMRVGVETGSGAGHILIGTNGQVTVGSLPSSTVYLNLAFLAAYEE